MVGRTGRFCGSGTEMRRSHEYPHCLAERTRRCRKPARWKTPTLAPVPRTGKAVHGGGIGGNGGTAAGFDFYRSGATSRPRPTHLESLDSIKPPARPFSPDETHARSHELAAAIARESYEDIEVHLDVSRSTYWCHMIPSERPTYTPALLRGLSGVQQSFQRHFSAAREDGAESAPLPLHRDSLPPSRAYSTSAAISPISRRPSLPATGTRCMPMRRLASTWSTTITSITTCL